MGDRTRRVITIMGWGLVCLIVLILVSWGSWNGGYKKGIASAVPVMTPSSVTATAPATAPVPQPQQPSVIVNPPAVVNVTVNQTVNGIETTSKLPSSAPSATSPSYEVLTGDFKANVYDSEGWYVGKFKELSIDHLWGSAGPINRTDNFRVYWEGSFSVATAGDYHFKVAADGGVQLFVDDYLIIDKKSLASQAVVEHEGSVNLSAGQHEVVLKYYETTGDATVRLLYGK